MARPSNWKHSPTTALRVPEKFAAELLSIARQMDEGKWSGEYQNSVQNPSGVAEGRSTQALSDIPLIQGTLTRYFPIAQCLKLPQQYAAFIESFVQNLVELENVARSFEPPFNVGDSVMIRFRYPDDYRVVTVLSIEPVRERCCSFLCPNPITGESMRWFWFAGSDVVPLRKDESFDSAVRRSIIQQACHRLFKTEFRDRCLGLGLGLWSELQEAEQELLDAEDEELVNA